MVDPFCPEISLMPARNHLDHCNQQHHLCFLTQIQCGHALSSKGNGFVPWPHCKVTGCRKMRCLQKSLLQTFFQTHVTWVWRMISFYSNGARKFWPKDILGSSKTVTFKLHLNSLVYHRWHIKGKMSGSLPVSRKTACGHLCFSTPGFPPDYREIQRRHHCMCLGGSDGRRQINAAGQRDWQHIFSCLKFLQS